MSSTVEKCASVLTSITEGKTIRTENRSRQKTFQIPSFLIDSGLELLFFGGKGGSGKTTTAAASALYHQGGGKKILIVSVDPAHSLGDVFKMKLDLQPREIKGFNGLFGMEMNAGEILARCKLRSSSLIEKAIERGTYFEKADIQKLFSLSMPGLDELTAIMEITRIVKKKEYDLIIVDTAPTGHTLVFLDLPGVLRHWIRLLDLMQGKYRYISKVFTGRYKKDEVDDFIRVTLEDLNYLSLLLIDQKRCEFVPVTNLDLLSIYETERLLEELEKHRIFVRDIVVNRINKSTECPLCKIRSVHHRESLEIIEKRFSCYNIVEMPLFPYEIQGLSRLIQFKEALSGHENDHKVVSKNEGPAILHITQSELNQSEMKERWRFPKEGVRLVMVGGKGGVGKTTIASIIGLHVSRRKKTIIVSTDPAHSLKDAFDAQAGGDGRIEINENLYILEINSHGLFQKFKNDYRETLGVTFGKLLKEGIDVKFDRKIIEGLIDLTPPGIDEIMALMELTGLLEEDFEICILDTSATGHLVRFLELPQAINDWMKALLRILSKYKICSREINQKMLDFLGKTKKIEKTLRDSRSTCFAAVSIAEGMGIAETERLLESLNNLSIPCEDVIFNFIIPGNICDFCLIKRAEQRKYINRLREITGDNYHIIEVPLFPEGIKGIESLTTHAAEIFSEEQ